MRTCTGTSRWQNHPLTHDVYFRVTKPPTFTSRFPSYQLGLNASDLSTSGRFDAVPTQTKKATTSRIVPGSTLVPGSRQHTTAGCHSRARLLAMQSTAVTAVPSDGWWRELSPEARNLAFNNNMNVGPEVNATFTGAWSQASQALRTARPQHLDIPYASSTSAGAAASERTCWDLYPSANDPDAPCLVFIHGGYWQRGSKEMVGCMAEGVLAHGWSAALPGYPLAPGASLTQIAAELRGALDGFPALAAARGMCGPFVLAGWSAGAHLAALLLDHPAVSAAVCISGVYDLYPLREAPHVNDALQLSEAECAGMSPVRLPATVDKPLHVAYGSLELPAMVDTSRAFHRHRAAAHLPGLLIPLPGANHFTVLEQLRLPDSLLTRTILQAQLR